MTGRPGGPSPELRQALGRPGCAVCHLTYRAVGRFLRSLAYEQVNDVQLRAELRTAHGFCRSHGQRWVGMSGNVLGTAIIYRDVITAAVGSLESAGDRTGLRSLLGGRARKPGCVACRAEAEAQDRYIDAVLDALDEPALPGWEGLCLPHTRRAVERGGGRAEPLVALARQHALQIVAELDEVIRKEDYRFTHEPRTEAERSAPGRAVAWTTGLDSGA